MSARKLSTGDKKMSSKPLPSSSSSSSILDVITDDADSMDEDSNSQSKYRNSVNTDDEHRMYQLRKSMKYTNQKSHRLIEKRRRDRMNRNLNILLDLIPHKKPESQRRIEKTEIIEMAVKYIRNFKPSNSKSFDPIDLNKKTNTKIDTYSSGYHNGAYDTCEYIEKHFNDDTLFSDLIHYIKEKEVALKDLIVVPAKKDKILCSKKSLCEPSQSDEHENLLRFSINDQPNSLPSAKVPIFVLHPSGTHYIPMSIDLSIVSHAFDHKPQSSSIVEQLQCHPVSIPVNFNPISTLSDPYELDIQNINVIGTRHQTSVRPN